MKRKTIFLTLASIFICLCAHGQTTQPLDTRIAAIMNRPEFQHALFGIEIYSVTEGKVLYQLNADKMFIPGSVTKVVTEGTVIELLGADYRFHTPVYRNGPLKDGV